jgi:hypothetical protein
MPEERPFSPHKQLSFLPQITWKEVAASMIRALNTIPPPPRKMKERQP